MNPDKRMLVRSSKVFPAMYEAHYEGGGELPETLKGKAYTHPKLVQEKIDIYLESMPVKQEKPSGGTGTKSRAN